MPYCKECGNFVEISGNLCSNCQNQAVSNEIPIIKPKKKARSRPLTLSRGLKKIGFLILVGSVLFFFLVIFTILALIFGFFT